MKNSIKVTGNSRNYRTLEKARDMKFGRNEKSGTNTRMMNKTMSRTYTDQTADPLQT